jgi:hypothetical protein
VLMECIWLGLDRVVWMGCVGTYYLWREVHLLQGGRGLYVYFWSDPR